MFEQELARLKTFGELLAEGGFDRSRAGEADEGLGFGEDEVP